MKFLILIAVLIQLSLAAAECADESTTIKVVQVPCEKLSPIFELIATKMQDFKKVHFPFLAEIANELLPECKKFVEAHKTERNEMFLETMEKFVQTVEEYKKDPESCKNQRATWTALVATLEKSHKDKELVEFLQKAAKDKNIKYEEDETAIRDIATKFPELIKNYVESATEEEKEKYSETFQHAEEILKASEGKEKFSAIRSFLGATIYDKHFIEATDDNCKWDYSSFDLFEKKLLFMSMNEEN